MATDPSEADDDLAPMPLVMRRNTWSFENRWIAKFRKSEAMDYGDDHETTSVTSCDSEADQGLPRRSSLKDLSKLADSAHSLDHSSPQLSPGLARRIVTPPSADTTDGVGREVKESSPPVAGLSNSMILNWLSFKKYQQHNTIEETSESPKESPVDSTDGVVAGPGQISPLPGPSINLSGRLLEAVAPFKPGAPTDAPLKKPPGMRRNFSLNEVGTAAQENVGMRRNFSFKELNAVAPSGW